ncbi:matrixin family metalloprotease [Micromonospora sp. STR1s_5]|nr:matrixin family metalloprotease [Micromonospora sp. STR1s_5]
MPNYSLEGPIWSSNTITWSLAQANYAGQVAQFGSFYAGGPFLTEIREAFAEWASVSNLRFVEVADSASVDIRLGMAAFDGPFGTLGDASYFYTNSNGRQTFQPNVVVRFDSGEQYSFVNGEQRLSAGVTFESVAMHEIGHALGLDHYSGAPAIMRPLASASITSLQQSDIEGIRALYGSAAALVAAYQTGSGGIGLWTLNGSQLVQSASGPVTFNGAPASLGPEWHALKKGAFADFDGNSTSDFLWQRDDGLLAHWSLNGTQINPLTSGSVALNGAAMSVGPDWHFEGTGDFKHDGASDILWRNNAGQIALWDMNGGAIDAAGSEAVTLDGAAVSVGHEWTLLATGDFGNDGSDDLLWQRADGRLGIWDMDDAQISWNGTGDVTLNGAAMVLGPEWQLLSSGDFNGDGSADLLWKNTSGQLALWEMNGTAINPSASGAVTYNGSAVTLGPEWKLASVGDVNGDGTSDLLWDNGSTSGLWEMNGAVINTSVTGTLTNSNGTTVTHSSDWHFV